ncbi:MAG: hypothetical protein H0T42_25980 [Deltaproteobacteria bacterium]|nr:hypothetical protein [Deltaproteobacteria bacterium]
MDLKLPMLVLAGTAMAGGGSTVRAPPQMPWLHGLDSVRVTDEPQRHVEDRMAAGYEDLECAAGATHGLVLKADIAPSAGMETILASYARGLVVLDHEDQVIASMDGYPCQGSADEVTSLAVGRAFLVPTIALAITHGGHEERTTELALFRIGFGGRIEPVFTAEVELRTGDNVRTGGVWLIPNGLLYQRPGGKTGLWIYDPVGGAYLYGGPLDETDEPPHAAPPPVAAYGS